MEQHQLQLPGLMTLKEAELRRIFLEQVKLIPGGERIKRCIQCGTCTGSCPVSYAMDISPRQLISLFRVGEIETIMKSRTIWICASCYACTTRCPSGIKITDIIYALKRTAMEKNYQSQQAPHVQILAKLFTQNLMAYGRLHEGTLIRKYYTKVKFSKLFKMIPLAKKMWRTKRISLLPSKIKAKDELAKIIKKAQEIDMKITEEHLEYHTEYIGYRAVADLKLEQRKGE